MVKIGLFRSEHGNVIASILNNISDDFEIITPDVSADILLLNQKPMGVETKSVMCEAAVVNTDDKQISKFLKGLNTRVITYGLNSKASVTASSLGDDRLVFCVQRSFLSLSGIEVLQQEFAIEPRFFGIQAQNDSLFVINCILPAVAAALVADVDFFNHKLS